MPLSSQHLHHSVISIIRDIPMDKESAPEYLYQTKVEMYDERCSGCGFARIEVYPSDVYNAKPVIFHKSQEAIDSARLHGHRINRTCEYPFDTLYRNKKPMYPSLTEIISNTCTFWDMDIPTSPEEIDIMAITELIKLMKADGEE